MNKKYGFGKVVEMSFETAIDRVSKELNNMGFGILTDIDIAATMKKKLGKSMPPYRILGACIPPVAYKAISSDSSIGLLLPCNIVVRCDDADNVYVECLDPVAIFNLVDEPEIHGLANEVNQRLKTVLESI